MHEGSELNGRYRVLRCIGRGGQGAVWLARHLNLDALVAIKELVLVAADEPTRQSCLRLFTNEGRTLTSLRHASLPVVSDFFATDDCHYYLVMDYIEGETLLKQLRRQGPQPPQQVRQWGLALADVLDYLHHHKPPVIMRDLKPDNIMLDGSGHIKLIDFGIAKVLDEHRPTDSTMTQARGAGTPGFAAIEQYGTGTDARTDIYALGATLYCMLAGEPPPPAPMLAAQLVTLTPLRTFRNDVPADLDQAIQSMLNLAASQRPQTMDEVRALLSRPMAATEPDEPVTAALVLRPEPGGEGDAKAPVLASPAEAEAPCPIADRDVERPQDPRPAQRNPPGSVRAGMISRIGWIAGGTAAMLTLACLLLWPTPKLTVHLETRPEGASVVVNKSPGPTTPCDLVDIPSDGPMLVELTLRGYQDWTRQMPVQASPAPIELIPAQAVWSVRGAPAATLQLEGGDTLAVGSSTASVGLQPGPHAFTITASGYRPYSGQIVVRPGQEPSPLAYALTPRPVDLTVHGPAGTTVTLQGHTGVINADHTFRIAGLEPGSYELAIGMGGSTYTSEVEVKGGEDNQFLVRDQPTPTSAPTAEGVAPVSHHVIVIDPGTRPRPAKPHPRPVEPYPLYRPSVHHVSARPRRRSLSIMHHDDSRPAVTSEAVTPTPGGVTPTPTPGATLERVTPTPGP